MARNARHGWKHWAKVGAVVVGVYWGLRVVESHITSLPGASVTGSGSVY